MNVGCNAANRLRNIAEVGFVILVQRRGYADNDDIHPFDFTIVRGGFEAILLSSPNLRSRDADDVGASLVKRAHLLRINIEACHLKFLFTEEKGQRKANVTHTDDANASVSGLDSTCKLGCLT